MNKIIICILLLTHELGDARKVNVNGASRGSSRQRNGYQQPRGYGPQQQNYQSSHGGYNQGGLQQPSPYHHSQTVGGHQPHGVYAPGQPKFNPGVGLGSKSSSSGTFKKALLGGALGAAGGLVVYELGKTILTSKSQPLQAPNGQSYYFDDKGQQTKNGYFTCSMPISEVIKTLQESSSPAPSTEPGNSTTLTPEQFFKTVQFEDGTRPRSLTWYCKVGSEVCCGTDCCPAPQVAPTGPSSPSYSSRSRGPSWIAVILGIFGGILLLMCCCCCLAYKLCRSAFDMCLPSRNTEENHRSPPEVIYTESPAPTGYSNTPEQMQLPHTAHLEYPQQAGYPPHYGYNYPSQPYPQQQQQQYY